MIFKSPIRTTGPTGQKVVSGFRDRVTCWAHVHPATQVIERFGHGEMYAVATHGIEIRGGPDIRNDWIAMWNGKTLNVQGVIVPGSGLPSMAIVMCGEIPPSTA
ncbi:hypothetical protein FRUB_09809 [Fimbriiglobus ruber]|uniref:Uncharacterized protein n=1 Tax=Fimbriiglobus ruber TaxID=1908690 RepID=A0A225DFV4_9BACT|nr:head-tail adaptor protein [Fimbriiglobus ruber]OWK34967.1 hypothetical protein FRUB_09809 [Fimbriiglobus ruber]